MRTTLDPLLVKEKQAAKMLSVCKRTLFNLRDCGALPYVKFGRSIWYDVADLKAWIAANKTVASPA